MDEAELLRRELRAAREELVRKRSRPSDDPDAESQLPLMPNRDEEFLRLALMSIDELEAHVDRLERDLSDIVDGFDIPPDAE
jgi:hypothetical protein